MPLSSEVTERLQQSVDAACANPSTDIPGLSVVVVGKDGKELFAHAAGKRGLVSSEPMTLDNVFWIASCTKMVAGVACMQLVEQGKLHLDDGDELERLCPELKSIKVLQKDGTLTEKNKKITLRMLLSHTGTSPFPRHSCAHAELSQLALVIHSLMKSFAIFPHRSASTSSLDIWRI